MRLSSTLQQGHSPTALVHQKWWDMDQLLDGFSGNHDFSHGFLKMFNQFWGYEFPQ